MNTYFSVVYLLNEKGESNMSLGSEIQAKEIPKDSFKVTPFGEVWVNWFSTKKDAIQYLKSQV